MRKGHLLQTDSQTCHQQMPKLQLAQREIKICPLRKPHGIEGCVVLCCPGVIHVGIIPPHLSGKRQRAAVMPRAAAAPTKSLGAQRLGSSRAQTCGNGPSIAPSSPPHRHNPCRRKGALGEAINCHDLMKTGENKNN